MWCTAYQVAGQGAVSSYNTYVCLFARVAIMPQTEWFKQQKCMHFSPQFWGLEVQDLCSDRVVFKDSASKYSNIVR